MPPKGYILDRPEKIIQIKVYPDLYKRTRSAVSSGRIRGTTSGMAFRRYFTFLLEINEYLPKEHKMTDYQIARAMVSEFYNYPKAREFLKPKKERNGTYYNIGEWRYLYNRGKFHRKDGGMEPRQGPVSFRYNNKGEKIRRPGMVLSPEKIQARINKYGGAKPGKQFDHEIIPTALDPVSQSNYKGEAVEYDSFDWII